jgi:hypothetical protein
VIHLAPPVRPLAAGVVALALLGACSQPVPQSGPSGAASKVETMPPAVTLEARFNPTAAIGLGANASAALSAEDLASVFAAVQQTGQMRFSANATPPGARGADVTSISIRGEDTGGILKGLDQTARRTLGDALLTAAGTAWPQARVSLLVVDPAGGSGQIVGSRPAGGPNNVIVM